MKNDISEMKKFADGLSGIDKIIYDDKLTGFIAVISI